MGFKRFAISPFNQIDKDRLNRTVLDKPISLGTWRTCLDLQWIGGLKTWRDLLNQNLLESGWVSAWWNQESPWMTNSHKIPILGIILHISVSESWMAEVIPSRVLKKVVHASSMLPSQCPDFTVSLSKFMHCSLMVSALGSLKSGGV